MGHGAWGEREAEGWAKQGPAKRRDGGLSLQSTANSQQSTVNSQQSPDGATGIGITYPLIIRRLKPPESQTMSACADWFVKGISNPNLL
ncbi:hypothetical protein [Microcoleus sp. B4-D4]|uniref:hypothetical protein n=1 Tax=Microcoleus sp. B4-D4 TaxID=2818667 RepID=UPI002FD41C78